jgi:ribosomal protein S18 acetylase RimI-like enzyme
MQQVYCRIATVNDATLLTEISRKTFYDTYHLQNTKANMDLFLEQNLQLSTIQNELTDPNNTFMLIYDGNELSGYAKLSEKNIPALLKDISVIEISRFYIVKEKIGKGIGKILMKECIDIAKEKCRQIIWLCVWQQNKRAIAFYKKNGFEIFAGHCFVLGNDKQDDWLMKKVLY